MARGHAILVMVAISVGALSATADPLFRQLEPFSGKVEFAPNLMTNI